VVAPADTGTFSLISFTKRILQKLTSLVTNTGTINTTLGSPFQAGGSIGNTAFGVNNGAGASAVNIQDGGNSITVDGTVTTTPSGTQDENLKEVNGVTILTGTGATGTGSQRVTVAVDSATVAGSSSLPSGTNNIGDVDVLSLIPGTGATSLGKAIDSPVGPTDTGIAILGKVQSSAVTTTANEGDYDIPSLTPQRELRTRDQRAVDLQNCNDSTSVTVLGNDTVNLADSLAHVFGVKAITFDKVNGAANTVYAGVQDTITAIDVQEVFESGGFVGLSVYLPTITNIQNVFLRIGTDSSNYNCWTWDIASLTAATWLNLRNPTASPDKAKSIGNGWDTNAITYVSFGCEFLAETSTLSGIIFDHVHLVGGRVTSTEIQASITSNVSSPNINLSKVGNQVIDHGSGAVSSGTLRTVLATDVPIFQGLGAWANGAETAVAGTAVQIQASNTSRKRLIIQNTGVANARIGITGVTTTTGVRLVPGGEIILEFPYVETNAIYAIREGAVSTTIFTQETT
jgi:hypothetical protein